MSILLIGSATQILLGCVLLSMPIARDGQQLRLVSQKENEFQHVAVSGLRFGEPPSTMRGQIDFSRDIGLELGKRVFFLTSRDGWGGYLGAFFTCGAAGSISIDAWFTCVGTILLLAGVANLLPLPTLNGWHIFVVLIEATRRRPNTDKFLVRSSCLGFAVVLAVGLRLIWMDVAWLSDHLFGARHVRRRLE